jgi:hypothetical protein
VKESPPRNAATRQGAAGHADRELFIGGERSPIRADPQAPIAALKLDLRSIQELLDLASAAADERLAEK